VESGPHRDSISGFLRECTATTVRWELSGLDPASSRQGYSKLGCELPRTRVPKLFGKADWVPIRGSEGGQEKAKEV